MSVSRPQPPLSDHKWKDLSLRPGPNYNQFAALDVKAAAKSPKKTSSHQQLSTRHQATHSTPPAPPRPQANLSPSQANSGGVHYGAKAVLAGAVGALLVRCATSDQASPGLLAGLNDFRSNIGAIVDQFAAIPLTSLDPALGGLVTAFSSNLTVMAGYLNDLTSFVTSLSSGVSLTPASLAMVNDVTNAFNVDLVVPGNGGQSTLMSAYLSTAELFSTMFTQPGFSGLHFQTTAMTGLQNLMGPLQTAFGVFSNFSAQIQAAQVIPPEGIALVLPSGLNASEIVQGLNGTLTSVGTYLLTNCLNGLDDLGNGAACLVPSTMSTISTYLSTLFTTVTPTTVLPVEPGASQEGGTGFTPEMAYGPALLVALVLAGFLVGRLGRKYLQETLVHNVRAAVQDGDINKAVQLALFNSRGVNLHKPGETPGVVQFNAAEKTKIAAEFEGLLRGLNAGEPEAAKKADIESALVKVLRLTFDGKLSGDRWQLGSAPDDAATVADRFRAVFNQPNGSLKVFELVRQELLFAHLESGLRRPLLDPDTYDFEDAVRRVLFHPVGLCSQVTEGTITAAVPGSRFLPGFSYCDELDSRVIREYAGPTVEEHVGEVLGTVRLEMGDAGISPLAFSEALLRVAGDWRVDSVGHSISDLRHVPEVAEWITAMLRQIAAQSDADSLRNITFLGRVRALFASAPASTSPQYYRRVSGVDEGDTGDSPLRRPGSMVQETAFNKPLFVEEDLGLLPTLAYLDIMAGVEEPVDNGVTRLPRRSPTNSLNSSGLSDFYEVSGAGPVDSQSSLPTLISSRRFSDLESGDAGPIASESVASGVTPRTRSPRSGFITPELVATVKMDDGAAALAAARRDREERYLKALRDQLASGVVPAPRGWDPSKAAVLSNAGTMMHFVLENIGTRDLSTFLKGVWDQLDNNPPVYHEVLGAFLTLAPPTFGSNFKGTPLEAFCSVPASDRNFPKLTDPGAREPYGLAITTVRSVDGAGATVLEIGVVQEKHPGGSPTYRLMFPEEGMSARIQAQQLLGIRF